MFFSKNIAVSLRGANPWRSAVFPGLVVAAALAVAVVGGMLNGKSGDDGVNGLVEALSSNSGNFLGSLGTLLPLGFAFVAGLVSAVNPCGFAMLPAYLGLYLGNEQSRGDGRSMRSLGRAIIVGGTVTFGFVALFSLAGIAIGLGGHSVIQEATPWFGVAVGVALAIAGAWLLGGGKDSPQPAYQGAFEQRNADG